MAARGARMPLLALTAALYGIERWLGVWLGDTLPVWGGRLAVKWLVRRLGVLLAAGLVLWVVQGYRDTEAETLRYGVTVTMVLVCMMAQGTGGTAAAGGGCRAPLHAAAASSNGGAAAGAAGDAARGRGQS